MDTNEHEFINDEARMSDDETITKPDLGNAEPGHLPFGVRVCRFAHRLQHLSFLRHSAFVLRHWLTLEHEQEQEQQQK